MRTEISNNEDVLDSRAVIERLEDMQEELDALEQDIEDASEAAQVAQVNELKGDAEAAERELTAAEASLAHWEDCQREEYQQLKSLCAEGEGFSDWAHGETLIRDSYFEAYARELAYEFGAIDKAAKWPNNCIDWGRAARELQMDYSAIEFGDVTYWIRS